MTFRKDINGLRAIAVLAVVLFHFQITGFSGGFVGVDVFFVISGYLMTAIIFNKLRDHRFSIIEFYLHRARRIIPALAVLCLVLTAFGYFFLLKADFNELSKYIRKSIIFTSNIELVNKTNYFAGPSKENWLLHTWSLAVEWQFYIIYPIVICILFKLFNEKITKYFLIALGILSLITSIIYTPISPSAAFYLLPTRAWEMIAGGLVFLYPCQQQIKLKRLYLVVGLLLVAISIFIFNDQYLWPSYFALLPVLGAMLIIYANQSNIVTDNLPFQWLGKISYSVYLWHWPIAVFLISTGKIDNILYVFIGILLSIILGSLSYFCIETRFKLKHSHIIEALKYILIVTLVSTLAREAFMMVKRDKITRFSYLEHIEENNPKNPQVEHCLLGDKPYSTYPECKAGQGEVSAIVFGNSFGDSLFSGVSQTNKQSTLQWTYAGCLSGNTATDTPGCKKFIENKLGILKNNYKDVPVIFITNLQNMDNKDYYQNILCDISTNHPLYIVSPIPRMKLNVPKALGLGTTSVFISYDEYEQQSNQIEKELIHLAKSCQAKILYTSPYLCNDKKACLGSKNGIPLYYDSYHLNENGSKLLSPIYSEVFNK